MSTILDTKASWRAAAVEWLPVVAGLLVLYVPTFYDLANTLWREDDYSYGPIILAVIVWLIWDRRRVLPASPARKAPVLGFSILVVGLLFYVLGRSQDINVLQIGSLIPVFAGVLLAMRGRPALRDMWFMLLFIVFLVPFPNIFVDAVTGPLKQLVSQVAENVLYAAGYPIARSGVMITIGQYQLLVADACSGINSMFSLTAMGLLYLYLVHRGSRLHNVLVLASLLPFAFCANVVRVIFLVLVTYHFGDAAGQGFLHGFSGMVLFAIALVSVVALDALLARIIKPGAAGG